MSPTSNLLARRIRRLAVVLEPKTLPLASHHRAARPGPAGLSSRPCMAGRRAVHCSHGPVSAQHCAVILNHFSIVLNSRNSLKLQKFVETCRSVQKLQNKFCMNPPEPLYTVGLTKLTFIQQILVQNYKNSNTRIFVYKYLHFLML
jgi:hypothetical protein